MADQLRKWYELELYWLYKQVDPQSAADSWTICSLKDSNYNDRSRYYVNISRVHDECNLPNYNLPVFTQLKSAQRLPEKDFNPKESYSKTAQND